MNPKPEIKVVCWEFFGGVWVLVISNFKLNITSSPRQVDAISDAVKHLNNAIEKFDKIHKDFQNKKKGPKTGNAAKK